MGTIRQFQSVAFIPYTYENITVSTVILNRSKCGSALAEHITQAHRVTAKSRQSCSKATSDYHLRTICSLTLVVLINLLSTSLASPVFVDNPSLAQFQSGRNIRHLPCIVRKSGRSGVCMFAIDCIKQNGTHLGTCIDRFYFGSCCQLKEDALPEISDNSIDQNTISHFSHEPTTLPTSSLFKLTTDAQTQPQHSSTGGLSTGSSSVTAPLRNITQSYAPSSTSGTPIKHTPSRRPPAHTTHKYSQFVVRTTAKSSLGLKPTAAPTTIKPPRRRTTVAAPVLTTLPPMLPAFEQRIETTTLPTKIFTFQIVETTMPTPTEATKLEEVPTTFRPFYTTRRTKPPANSSVTRVKTTTALPTTTSVGTTTARPTPPLRNTYRPNPQYPKKPTSPPMASPATAPPTTAKTTQTKRPTSRPTRKPVVNATIEKIKPPVTHTSSSATVRRPPATTTTNNEEVPTTFSQTQPTQKPTKINNTTPTSTSTSTYTQTTRAPRPKPKPTAHIVKVPKPATEAQPGTVPQIHTSTTVQATTKPIPQIQTSSTVATKSQPTTTHAATTTTTTTATATHTTTPTNMPSTVTRIPTTTSTTERPTTTSTTPAPVSSTTTTTTLTTEAPKVELPITATETTLKPGLVTWTDVEAEPVTNASTIDGWQPLPPASDWVPVSTIAPEHVNQTNTAVSSTAYTTETTPTASSTEKIIVSVSSSVSEVMHNVSSSMPRPERPVLTTISTTATKAPRPKPTTSSASITSSTSSPSTPTIPSTSTTTKPTPSSEFTEMPMDFNITTGFDTTTEGGVFGTGTGTGSSTTEYTTEDFNATVDMTTISPVNSLEGMDYRQICGRRMFPEPRIVGGSNAAFGRWPWQISLRQWRTSTYLHKCGAALLNENWAITAAHCVDNVPPSDLLLRLGEYDLAEEEEPYGYQERRVQIVASHPQFDPRTFEYDLALLRFYEPVVFQPNIIPVCVPNSDLDFIGQTAFVTGWGRLYEDGPLPSVLQEVAVPIINNTICEGMYRSAGYIEHIPHIFICAGWKKGGYDSCEGDSGGPMVLQREDDKRFQLGGVISWGIGCAEANQPGVYTRISEFRDWINQILQF